jgi:hypothetical protein
MINQYVVRESDGNQRESKAEIDAILRCEQILREIGRGQHGQVRLGQDVTVLEKLEKSRNASNAAAIDSLSQVDQTGHARTLSWAESISPVAEPEGSSGPGTTPTTGSSGYWAIKIMDRQPRKKLPGIRKSSGAYSNGPNDAKQITATNEKYTSLSIGRCSSEGD